MPLSWFQLLDQDADGFVTLDELESILSMNWNSPQAAYTARKAFALPEPVELLEALDRDRDDRISREELDNLLRLPKHRAPEVCSTLRTKSESCKSRDLLQCSGYIPAAEAACRNGHDNLVQKCIENHACEDICSCIRSVEKAALGQSDLRSSTTHWSVKHKLHVVRGVPHRHDVGHHKRLLPALFAAALTTILEIDLGALVIALSARLMEVRYFYGFRFTSVTYWDPDGSKPPPACSTYIFWSRSCGAILSEKSHRCDPQGTRVYDHSCWDHFRYGSRGCGFLYGGCKSLCANVNTDGCPCSLINNYDMQPDVSYPGTAYTTVDISAPSACAELCNKDANCLVFEIPPLTADHQSPQCLLKGSKDIPVTLTGTTSFVKKTTSPRQCTGNVHFQNTRFGDDWFSDGSPPFRRRGEANEDERQLELLDEHKLQDGLNPAQLRGLEDGKTTFAFPNQIRTLAALLAFLYSRSQPNLNGDEIFRDIANVGGHIWPFYRPTDVDTSTRPEVTIRDPGGWNWAEVTQRVLNAWRRFVLDQGVLPSIPANPASDEARVIPPDLRSIIADNTARITESQTWDWRGATAGGARPPHVGIVLPQASNVGYFQRGAVGPTSLEAAFILGLQIAGVNFVAVRSAMQSARAQGSSNAGDFTSSMRTGNLGEDSMCVQAYSRLSQGYRNLGQFSNRYNDALDRGPSNGIYLTFDLDPDLPDNEANMNNNILVFAVHMTDPEARLRLNNNNAALNNPTFTGHPADNMPGANDSGRGGPVRVFAHAHVGTITRRQLNDFNRRAGQDFPEYEEIGKFHFYINPEESASDPRQQYRNQEG
ncbi:hypothetical protein K437DRAFT_67747 [Tilletiaria anomala UBC 951]|uniref:EF-hand n=1 Tax=Tilletiaria anomala (strain ATCC 24038 / CBS 436.72 / UBC 951) TaxID=1037660 RepID=A0A066V6E8_TILAU|nr:uncharacterized protein K437DRAFT_67747 [Tilletiaria anomala UBC 951]KDN35813.1 hypothetical protein K437DRAFT_67747 [Tilletiaria anomala UBC 951]